MAKLLTIETVACMKGMPVWFETHNGKVYTGWGLVYELHSAGINPGVRVGITQPSGHIMWMLVKWYGCRWRCWDSPPTNGELEREEWEATNK